jgi:hypothetical protein
MAYVQFMYTLYLCVYHMRDRPTTGQDCVFLRRRERGSFVWVGGGIIARGLGETALGLHQLSTELQGYTPLRSQ